MLVLVLLEQDRENVEAIEFGGSLLGVEENVDTTKRRLVVLFISQRPDVHRYTSFASILSYSAHGAFRQGRTPIDEEDFYTIAGDKHAVAIVRAQREGLVAEQIGWQLVGYGAIPVMFAGIGGLAGGIALLDEDIDGLGAGALAGC